MPDTKEYTLYDQIIKSSKIDKTHLWDYKSEKWLLLGVGEAVTRQGLQEEV